MNTVLHLAENEWNWTSISNVWSSRPFWDCAKKKAVHKNYYFPWGTADLDFFSLSGVNIED